MTGSCCPIFEAFSGKNRFCPRGESGFAFLGSISRQPAQRLKMNVDFPDRVGYTELAIPNDRSEII